MILIRIQFAYPSSIQNTVGNPGGEDGTACGPTKTNVLCRRARIWKDWHNGLHGVERLSQPNE